jgi:hypothetical protein
MSSQHRLLVLACSASKRPDPGRIPARDRYDGPLRQTLHSADPKGRRAKVASLSARFGFRDAETPIEDCDARLTTDLAERMIAGGVTTRWPLPPSPRRPGSYGMHPGHEIASLMRYGHARATEIISYPPIDGGANAGGSVLRVRGRRGARWRVGSRGKGFRRPSSRKSHHAPSV